MFKKQKLFFGIFASLVAVVFLTITPCAALSIEKLDDYRYKTYDLYIKNYDIEMNVGEDNRVEVKEKLDVHFNKRMHGIYRDLILRDEVDYGGGNKVKRRAGISNIKTSEHHSTETNNGVMRIKLGDANSYVSGDKTYTLSYTYDLGEDVLSDVDDFYFTIIPGKWTVPILLANIKITMPKEFDSEKVNFWSGTWGRGDNEIFDYSVNGLEISGKTNRVILPGEMVTARVVLDEGYFVRVPAEQEKPWLWALYVIPIITAIGCFVLWLIYGNDERVEISSELYPPKDISYIDMAIIDHGNFTQGDVLGLIYMLADRGYLQIEESNKGDSFYFTKLRDYDGDDEIEREVMNELFSKKYAPTEAKLKKEEGFDSNLERAVSTKLYSIQTGIYRKIRPLTKNKERLAKYYEDTKMPTILACILTFAAIISLGAIFFFATRGELGLPVYIVVFFILALYAVFITAGAFCRGAARALVITFTSIHSVFTSIIAIAIFSSTMMIERFFVNATLTCIASIVVSVIFILFMPKYTNLGLQYYAKVKGYKNNLRDLMRNRNRSLEELGSEYIYSIIPYAFLFRLYSSLANKYRKLDQAKFNEAPVWYISHHSNGFKPKHLSKNITTTYQGGTGYSSSGGGGGFSGGGFGGGGGGGGW